MTLYEIDDQIMRILALLEPDPVTGEIIADSGELDKQLQELKLQRVNKLEGVARFVLNIRSEAEMLKAEEQRLAERRSTLEKKEKSLLSYLDYACGGQKTDLGIATVCYRKSEKVEVSDEKQALLFLVDNHHTECLRFFDPEISKKEVKELINSGTEVPGIAIVQSMNCSLR